MPLTSPETLRPATRHECRRNRAERAEKIPPSDVLPPAFKKHPPVTLTEKRMTADDLVPAWYGCRSRKGGRGPAGASPRYSRRSVSRSRRRSIRQKSSPYSSPRQANPEQCRLRCQPLRSERSELSAIVGDGDRREEITDLQQFWTKSRPGHDPPNPVGMVILPTKAHSRIQGVASGHRAILDGFRCLWVPAWDLQRSPGAVSKGENDGHAAAQRPSVSGLKRKVQIIERECRPNGQEPCDRVAILLVLRHGPFLPEKVEIASSVAASSPLRKSSIRISFRSIPDS